ncbi:hypothetical protein ACQKWADRAFT_44064 [Trichoderma austrokoningii]
MRGPVPVLFLRNEAGQSHTVRPPLARDSIPTHSCTPAPLGLQLSAHHQFDLFRPDQSHSRRLRTHTLQYHGPNPSPAARVLLVLLARIAAANRILPSAQIPPYRVASSLLSGLRRAKEPDLSVRGPWTNPCHAACLALFALLGSTWVSRITPPLRPSNWDKASVCMDELLDFRLHGVLVLVCCGTYGQCWSPTLAMASQFPLSAGPFGLFVARGGGYSSYCRHHRINCLYRMAS